jgi:Coenzyme PQQ synthesis protein D (PqqD)
MSSEKIGGLGNKAMPMNLLTIVKQSKDQASCCLNDEVAILNLQSAMYFGLDEVGAFIWQALNEPRPMSEICSMVLDSFEVDTERCSTDVFNFITKLEKEGLVELEEASGGVRAPLSFNAAHT